VGDHRYRIVRLPQFISEWVRFLLFAGIAQEFVDVHQSWPGKHALVADARKFLEQILKQGNFQIVARSKIGVTTLAGKWPAPLSVPVESGLAQTGARRDQSAIDRKS